EALLEEERRVLYVAMTRARDHLYLIAPLKFPLTSKSAQSDAHVYGGRSRFLTEKVLKTMEPLTFHGSQSAGDGTLSDVTGHQQLDLGAKARSLW
ncbi:MAG: hypothetical protein NZM12_10240, partial [Steroidobacteraceae bacterium]|nr:hypothetical protein [Steroidobacteraceae bacterium]MDW8260406.1 3'-5' exonuclease [Gammaproteobacteria bacterium]